MKYPEEFKKRVKELYPEDVYLQILMEQNSPKAMNLLITASREELIRAVLRCKTIEEAHAIALREIERDKLNETRNEIFNML